MRLENCFLVGNMKGYSASAEAFAPTCVEHLKKYISGWASMYSKVRILDVQLLIQKHLKK